MERHLIRGRHHDGTEVHVLEDTDVYPEFGSHHDHALADNRQHKGLFRILIGYKEHEEWDAVRAREGTTTIVVKAKGYNQQGYVVLHAYRNPEAPPFDAFHHRPLDPL